MLFDFDVTRVVIIEVPIGYRTKYVAVSRRVEYVLKCGDTDTPSCWFTCPID